jgi:cell division transport system permease protein
MPIFAEYAVRETASNLWRNRLMTIAAILTVAVSLTLVGVSLLIRQGASNASAQWQRDTQVIVWMAPDASTAELGAVQSQLKTMSPTLVNSCVYRSQSYDYAEARRLLDSPVEFSVLRVQDVPSSFRCTPTQLQDAQVVITRFGSQPGVFNVTAPLQQIHAMEKAVNILQWVLFLVAAVLLLSAVVLILNTIRLAIFARRREVSVMKLVGATNWFIRIPFMSEGMIQGLFGSALAAAIVYGIHLWLNSISNPNNTGSLLTQLRLSGWQVFWTDAILVMVGIVVGVFGSLTAIRRFLDV